ncbi:MAG: Ig-like domain-containing protein [Verrucomicrobiota bacterium]|jgi:hypothetical protein
MCKSLWERWPHVAALFAGFVIVNQAPADWQTPPFVTVQSTDPLATEPGNNPGSFTIARIGGTNSALTVDFTLGGTATNGVDYLALPTSVTLAAGQVSSNLAVTPVTEPSATGYKTVKLALSERGRRETPAFVVGSLNKAVVYIVYKYTNVPPAVSIVTPTNDTSFLSRPNVEIAASASDSNGWVTAVKFLADGTALGTVTNAAFPTGPGQPQMIRQSNGSTAPVFRGDRASRFQFVWTNVPPGAYSLTAVATDNAGLQTTSSVVSITVTTNLPEPRVRLVNPVAGAEFPDLAAINLYAAAGEVGGVVDTVEFFANGGSLGMVTNYLAAEPVSLFHLRLQWLPYHFQWANAPVGSNILTAVAIDNNGTLATSAPVSITVTTNVYHRHRGW